tara:strand:+ start:16020 stop:16592 length:573 start_codon:yes stop_codon:yes gene_type:complete
MNKIVEKIGLFGTSADPPTIGHLAILKNIVSFYPMIIAWASNNPMKIHRESLEDRSLMLKTVIDNLKDPRILFDQDISSPWTISTIKKAKVKWPETQLDMIIGSDLLSEILHWKDIDLILKETHFKIVPREGWVLNHKVMKEISSRGGSAELMNFKIPNTSSSKIISKQKLYNVPSSIKQLIIEKKLYNS